LNFAKLTRSISHRFRLFISSLAPLAKYFRQAYIPMFDNLVAEAVFKKNSAGEPNFWG
jgi:hypothetical protein